MAEPTQIITGRTWSLAREAEKSVTLLLNYSNAYEKKTRLTSIFTKYSPFISSPFIFWSYFLTRKELKKELSELKNCPCVTTDNCLVGRRRRKEARSHGAKDARQCSRQKGNDWVQWFVQLGAHRKGWGRAERNRVPQSPQSCTKADLRIWFCHLGKY